MNGQKDIDGTKWSSRLQHFRLSYRIARSDTVGLCLLFHYLSCKLAIVVISFIRNRTIIVFSTSKSSWNGRQKCLSLWPTGGNRIRKCLKASCATSSRMMARQKQGVCGRQATFEPCLIYDKRSFIFLTVLTLSLSLCQRFINTVTTFFSYFAYLTVLFISLFLRISSSSNSITWLSLHEKTPRTIFSINISCNSHTVSFLF